jgi:hypothetical protein
MNCTSVIPCVTLLSESSVTAKGEVIDVVDMPKAWEFVRFVFVQHSVSLFTPPQSGR